jgi:hypothetical protein
VIFGSTWAGGVEEFSHSELFRLNDEAFGNELAAPLCSTVSIALKLPKTHRFENA